MKTTQIFTTIVLLFLFQYVVYSQNEIFTDPDIMQLSKEKLTTNEYPLLINQKITKENISRRSDNFLVLDSIVLANGGATVISYDDLNRVKDIQFRTEDYIWGELGFVYVEDTNQIDLMIQFGYPGINQPPDFIKKFDYTYNTDGFVSRLITESEDPDGLIDEGGVRYAYDINGNLINSVSFDLDQDSFENDTEITDYFYDQFSKLDSVRNYFIDSDTNNESLFYSENFTYDESDNLILKIWNYESFTLNGTEEMTYDSIGNVLSLLRIVDSNSYNSQSLRAYEYNYDVSTEDLITHFTTLNRTLFSSTLIHKSQLLRSIFSSNGDEDIIRTYHWSENELNTSVAATDIKSINTYPNPVSSTLEIQNLNAANALELIVYDLLGRRVLDDKVMHSHQQVDVSSLVEGNYFFTLQDARQILFSGRFIKSKSRL